MLFFHCSEQEEQRKGERGTGLDPCLTEKNVTMNPGFDPSVFNLLKKWYHPLLRSILCASGS